MTPVSGSVAPHASGIFLIDKEAGPSSAQALTKIKKILKPSKIGHAGTLDPFATGLLVVMIGRATKLAQYAEEGHKTYSGVARLGVTTDTEDYTGKVLEERPVSVHETIFPELIKKYTGVIQQVPPCYSAIQVDGVRSYERARKGEQFVLNARTVQIHSLEIALQESNQLFFRVSCSSGTYIRSLLRDIGEDLGCGASLLSLRREASLPFSVAHAVPIQDVSWQALLSWELLFPHMQTTVLTNQECMALEGGRQEFLKNKSLDAQRNALLLYKDESLRPRGLLVFEGVAWRLLISVA